MSCKYNNCKHCGYKSECEIYKENAELRVNLKWEQDTKSELAELLGKANDENAELKDKLNNLSSVAEVRLANWQKYEAENEELKKKIENLQKYLDTQNCYRECAETWEKLIKAKNFMRQLCSMVRELNNPNVQLTDVDASLSEAEQFLKECE